MPRRSTSVSPSDDAHLGPLVSHAGDLKGELVAFAASDRFRAEWRAFDVDPAALDPSVATFTIDEFILQHRLTHGGSIVERFVAERRPPLSLGDKGMLLGWREVVLGVFEVVRCTSAAHLHNLVDDLAYEVHATVGPTALRQLRPGMFLIARIVPLGHGTDVWILSGNPILMSAKDRASVAEAALQHLTAHPEALRRNPRLLAKAWETQRELRDEFVARFDSDVVVLPPLQAQAALREYHGGLREKVERQVDISEMREVDLDELSTLPADLLDADTVGIIFDEDDGLGFYRDFGAVDAFFGEPAGAKPSGAEALRSYLEDDSIAPSVLYQLIRRHPGTADEAFGIALGRPDFSWARDGAEILRRNKRDYAGRERTPTTSVLGDRLAQLLRARP